MKGKVLRRVVGLLAIMCFFIPAGCQLEDSSFPGVRLEERHLTLTASCEDDADTKTIRDDEARIYWEAGDAISLFFGSGDAGGSEFTSTLSPGEISLVTDFEGVITVVTGASEVEGDEYFWALYPYQCDAVCNGTSMTMTFPSEQVSRAGSFGTGMAPSMAKSLGLSMSFRNVWTGFGFTVSEDGYTSLTFRGNNGEPLAGRAVVGYDEEGQPKVLNFVDGVNEIVLKPDGDSFIPGKYYYLQFYRTDVFENGYTVTLRSATKTGTLVRSGVQSFNRSRWKRLANLDTRDGMEFEEIMDIKRTDIKDEHFANYLFSRFDTNGDGVLSLAERNAVTSITVRTDTIASLQGIEYFKNLTYLNCRGVNTWNNSTQSYTRGQLTSLDVSHNTKLQALYCYYNNLTSLDLSKNTELTDLVCHQNQLTSLDISNNVALTYLEFSSNLIETMDLSKASLLKEVHGSSNQLKRLDVSHLPGLQAYSCSYNPLEVFDISKNTSLTYLACSGLSLTSLSVSHLPELQSLECNSNRLESLDVSNNSKLNYLRCGRNSLTSLDVTKNQALGYLDCYGNPGLSQIDLSKNPQLYTLYCYSCAFSELDVSANLQLRSFDCNPNGSLNTIWMSEGQQAKILNEGWMDKPSTAEIRVKEDTGTSIDIDATNFPDEKFRAYVAEKFDINGNGKLSEAERNAVSEISVSTEEVASLSGIGLFPNLQRLSCEGGVSWNNDTQKNELRGQLTNLDVSGTPALRYLYCYGNPLTELDLSSNTALEVLSCSSCLLSSLDVSLNTALQDLDCSGNSNLRSIHMSNNSALLYLYCGSCALSSLDVSCNQALLTLDCSYNNNLTSLNVSNNSALLNLNCGSCTLSSLDVSYNQALLTLNCSYNNSLTSLNVSNNRVLQNLRCNSCRLASLDLSSNEALIELSCGYNQLASLDVSHNTRLQSLSCAGNTFRTLDLRANTALTYIYAWNCYNMTTVLFPETLPEISNSAFCYCYALKEVDIPASVIRIRDYAFRGCTGLQSIIVRSTTPPAGGSYMFDDTNECPIAVPSASLAAYQTAAYWSDYAYRIGGIASGDNEDVGYNNW